MFVLVMRSLAIGESQDMWDENVETWTSWMIKEILKGTLVNGYPAPFPGKVGANRWQHQEKRKIKTEKCRKKLSPVKKKEKDTYQESGIKIVMAICQTSFCKSHQAPCKFLLSYKRS